MSWNKYVPTGLVAVLLIAGSNVVAQTPSTVPPSRTNSSGNRTVIGTPPVRVPGTSVGTGLPGSTGSRTSTGGTNRREPCWQVAGVPKSAMDERHTIAMQTRSEVQAVCANAALSAAQKQERIREIHQQERQQLDGLISPAQREAMHACQQERGGGGHGGGGGNMGGGHSTGPCGVLSVMPKRLNETEGDEEIPKN